MLRRLKASMSSSKKENVENLQFIGTSEEKDKTNNSVKSSELISRLSSFGVADLATYARDISELHKMNVELTASLTKFFNGDLRACTQDKWTLEAENIVNKFLSCVANFGNFFEALTSLCSAYEVYTNLDIPQKVIDFKNFREGKSLSELSKSPHFDTFSISIDTILAAMAKFKEVNKICSELREDCLSKHKVTEITDVIYELESILDEIKLIPEQVEKPKKDLLEDLAHYTNLILEAARAKEIFYETISDWSPELAEETINSSVKIIQHDVLLLNVIRKKRAEVAERIAARQQFGIYAQAHSASSNTAGDIAPKNAPFPSNPIARVI